MTLDVRNHLRHAALWIVIVLLASAAPATAAQLQITAGPVLLAAPNAPLARVLEVSSNVRSRISVTASDGEETWHRQFDGLDRTHALPLLGFKSGRTYTVHVTLRDTTGATLEAPPLTLTTAPLPADFPSLQILASDPDRMEPGYTLFGIRARLRVSQRYTVILDAAGDVVWYNSAAASDIRQLPNGNLLFLEGDDIQEMTLLGEVVNTWHASLSTTPAPAGSIPVEMRRVHHEVFPTAHGTLLTLDQELAVVPDYPTSDTNPSAPRADATVINEIVLEFDPLTGETINRWRLLDMLDPHRIGFNSLNVGAGGGLPGFSWSHTNAVIHDARDDSVIVSLRHQDAVIKFSRTTGELIWILGTHDNWGPAFQPYLLTPVGQPFAFQFHQHAPQITKHGTVMLFDNGNFRASPFVGVPVADRDNFSRAVEYRIDEETMEVEQVWEYGGNTPERLFSSFISDANALPVTDNVLVTFGGLSFVDGQATPGNAVRIVEVDRAIPATKVFELSVVDPSTVTGGWQVYRSTRIPNLYPVRPLSVALVSDVPSPVELGSSGAIVFTATAFGDAPSYEYRFRVKNPSGTWSLGQRYGDDDTFTWTPPGEGRWAIQVSVRASNSTAPFEARKTVFVDVVGTAPVRSVSLVADRSSPAPPDAVVTFTASAAGGSGTYVYEFALRDPSSGAWSVAQAYGASPVFPWTPASPGRWAVQVRAKNEGSASAFDARRTLWFDITD